MPIYIYIFINNVWLRNRTSPLTFMQTHIYNASSTLIRASVYIPYNLHTI